MGKMKKAYLEEIGVVNEVIESLSSALQSEDTEFEIITDKGYQKEKSNWISREEFLEFMIEYAINTLSGSVGYIFPDEEKSAKK